MILIQLCSVILLTTTNGYLLGNSEDDEILHDKRFLLAHTSKQGWTTLEQFSSCALTCVPNYEKLTQACCDTGLDALCSNLPWSSLKAKLGTCVDLSSYGLTTKAWSSLEQFAACFLTCVPEFEKLTEVCCQTGLDAVCMNLPWDSLRAKLGQCQAKNPCSANPCVHGSCTSGGGSFRCACLPGFFGQLCNKSDPCSASPCKHGVCTTLTNGTFQCTCSSGYTGQLCDQSSDPCRSNPCIHGTCSASGNYFTCNCDQGFIGQFCERLIKDCKDVQDGHVLSQSGDAVYTVTINGQLTSVLCDIVTQGGGWTVIMNRENANQNFEDQSYSAYADGFGDVRSNFWAGLETMHGLTNDGRRYQLRVELEVANGTKYYATYDDFSVGPPRDYVLHVGHYSGNAGDSLSKHSGFGFTTKDVDHDGNPNNCGLYIHGAWWFHSCYNSCLTCPYVVPGTNNCRSFSWNKLAYCTALKSARMMVRPI